MEVTEKIIHVTWKQTFPFGHTQSFYFRDISSHHKVATAKIASFLTSQIVPVPLWSVLMFQCTCITLTTIHRTMNLQKTEWRSGLLAYISVCSQAMFGYTDNQVHNDTTQTVKPLAICRHKHKYRDTFEQQTNQPWLKYMTSEYAEVQIAREEISAML